MINNQSQQPILEILFDAMDLSSDDKLVIKKMITKTIVAEIGSKIVDIIPEKEVAQFLKKIENIADDANKLDTLSQELAKKYPEAKDVIDDYFKNEYPKFIEKLLDTYLEKASPEKKKEFLKLVDNQQ